MKNYIGTKIINASPMTLLAYNQLIGAGSGDIGRSRIPNGDGMANDGWYD